VDVRTAQQTLADLAARQHGVFGARQLPALGIDGWHVSELVRRGSVQRLAPQVYRMAGVPPSWRGDLSAGLHALGPDGLVSHRAAAQLHRFDEFRYHDLEFTVRRRRRGAFFLEATIHTSLVLAPCDVAEIDGLRVTSPVRTIIDLAGVRVSDRRLEAAVDTAVRCRLATLEDIADRLTALRGKGRRGVRRLDRILVTSGGHSFLEREFLKLVERVGLPPPIPQVEHRVDGVHIARVDFLYPDQGIVVEVSGGRGHSSAADRAKDARRRNDLQRLGRLVLEFTYEDVMQRAPYVAQSLRTALTTTVPPSTPSVSR
jgi:hypothetical protein